MKTVKGTILLLTVIGLSAIRSLAIESLQIAVPGTNAVLWWPSDTSESYLIQYRHTLSVTDSWTTLADYYPPDYSGSNVTYFVDTNFVDFGSGAGASGTNTGGGGISPMMATSVSGSTSSEPMVLEPNGDTVPLFLYPAGADLSGLAIIDPSTGQSISGSGLVRANAGTASPNGIQPAGADSSTNSASPGTGFYQVVRDGAHMFGVTNGAVWTGKVNVQLEVANPDGKVMTIAIYAVDPDTGNAGPIGNSQETGPFSGQLITTVDTTLMSNAVYNLEAYAHWEDDIASNTWEAISPPVSVTTSNEITFENFMPQFGDPNDVPDFGATNYSLVFNATSAHTNVNYTVDFYDSSSNYVGSVAGYSPDGNISFTWDLTDGQGVAHTNDAFFNSKISTQYIDPPAPTFWKNSDKWLGPGQWAIAAMHVFEPPWVTISAIESDAIYNQMDEFVAQAGGNGGLNVNTPANPADGSAYAINGTANSGAVNWSAFRAAIYGPYTRNLVYFGHGGPGGLGYDSSNTNVYIPVTEIAARLHNNMNGTNGHAFRFAFIDACDTANGNLCSALGIMQKQNVPFETYFNSRIRPGAYCGWPTAKWIAETLGHSANHDHINYMTHLQHIWYFYPQTIKVASIQAWGFNDAYGMQNNDLVINGYWNLLPAAYNQ